MVDSIKEALNINTQRSTADANLLKVNKQINSTILSQVVGVTSIADKNKQIAKNQKVINKTKALEASLETAILTTGKKNAKQRLGLVETASELSLQLDNEIKKREELLEAAGRGEEIDKNALANSNKIVGSLGAELDERIGALTAEEKKLLFTKNNIKLLEEQNKERATELKLAEKIEEKLGVAGKLNKLLGAIPGIGDSATKALATVTKELERAANNGEKLPSKAKIAKMQFKELGKNIVKDVLDPTTLLVGAVTMFVKLIGQADKEATELAMSLGISRGEAVKLSKDAREIAEGFEGVNRADILASQKSLNEYFGVSAQFSADIAGNFANIQKRTGLSDKAMGFFTKTSMKGSKTIDEILVDVNKTTLEFNKQNKISLSNKQVQEGIAKLSNTFKLQTKGGVQELAKAVIEAKALGTSMETVAGISSSLLDFESSIQNELQAELLLGQDIQLESARALALQGKKVEAAKEALKNESIMKAFQTDNVIAQEAAAKAVGMTVDQLADVVTEQEQIQALQKAYGNEVTNISEAQDEYNKRRAEGMSAEEASVGIADDSLKKQLETQSNAMKMEETMNSIKEVFLSIAEDVLPVIGAILGPIAFVIESMAEGIKMFVNSLKEGNPLAVALAGVLGLMALPLITSAIGGIFTALSMLGPLGIPLAGIAVAGMMSKLSSGKAKAKESVKDGVIGPGGEMVVSGPKGSIQLDKDDSIIAGTNLGGKGKGGSSKNNINIQPIVAAINAQNTILNQIAAKSPVIEMGGNEVGQGINTAEREIQ